MANILVLHGPNLNMLGVREPEEYGYTSLEDINARLQEGALKLGHQLHIEQHNNEANLITSIHQTVENQTSFIIINPAAFAHTSIALRDALLAVAIPFIEVHLTNTFGREKFRRVSFLADIAQGVIIGLGAQSYELALIASTQYLS